MSILYEVNEAVIAAREKYPQPFHSRHEGIAIMREEFEELWDSIKLDCDDEELKIEALHVAVTAVRFIEDLL